MSGRYGIETDGLDGDRLNPSFGFRGQPALAYFSHLCGASASIWGSGSN